MHTPIMKGWLRRISCSATWDRVRPASPSGSKSSTRRFGSHPTSGWRACLETEAILELLEPLWTRCLSLGLDVVLDYGFWTRKERDEVRAVVERLGASACLYRLECPDDEARRRIDARNQADDHSLYIAPATYEALRRRFEPLDVDEAFVEVAPAR